MKLKDYPWFLGILDKWANNCVSGCRIPISIWQTLLCVGVACFDHSTDCVPGKDILQCHIQTQLHSCHSFDYYLLFFKLQFKYFLKDPVKYDVKYQVSHLMRIVMKLGMAICRVFFILKHLKNLEADRSFDDNTLLDYRLAHSRSWCLAYSLRH